MLLANKLIGFVLRQAIGAVAGDESGEIAANVAGQVVRLVERHFFDHSQTLPKALARANDRAWQSLSIALVGNTFLDRMTLFFASGDDKGIREQVSLFLQDKTIAFESTSPDFRRRCVTELIKARKNGRLSAKHISGKVIANHAASFRHYADLKGMVDGAHQVVSEMADGVAAEFPNLGQFLRSSSVGGTSFLVSAFAHFLRKEVETNNELAHGLFFDGLRQLSASQARAFLEIEKALISLGDQFEEVFEQLGRIETVVLETQGVVTETHSAVLDMQAELQRIGGLHLSDADELRRLMHEVLNRVTQADMQKCEVEPRHSFSIRSESERVAVKHLLDRFRRLPAAQRKEVPALLNGLGKLQFGSQDFDGARHTFMAVACEVHDAGARAEAHFNAYRAALEEKSWGDALAAIQNAAALDAQRFALFPMQRYQPKQLLGAGGFGAAFLCYDRYFNTDVVVKALHETGMQRDMTDVFREAQILRQVQHPTIIAVRDCSYADVTKETHPYIVMDYFPGKSLASFVQERGAITLEDMIVIARLIAYGMRAAHQLDILHRDLKPDNILVRKEGSTWNVKIIDFGLALRRTAIERSIGVGMEVNTILGGTVAGTIEYAPPEQMGKLKGVKPGPYSDVYAFGKTCYFAMFKTTEPKNRHWAGVPKELHDMLEACTEQELRYRLPDFGPVLSVLHAIDGLWPRRETAKEGLRQAELKQGLHRDHDAALKQKTVEKLQRDGEDRLTQSIRIALDREEGELTTDVADAANEICRQFRIGEERGNEIVEGIRAQWYKARSAELLSEKVEKMETDVRPHSEGLPKDASQLWGESTAKRANIASGTCSVALRTHTVSPVVRVSLQSFFLSAAFAGVLEVYVCSRYGFWTSLQVAVPVFLVCWFNLPRFLIKHELQKSKKRSKER